LIDPENGNFRVAIGQPAAVYGCQTFADGIEEYLYKKLDVNLINYPNPFNPNTRISFDVLESASIKLVVYNSSGETVWKKVEKNVQVGTYLVDFKGDKLKSDIYFCRLTINGKSVVKKMVLIR